MKTNIYNESKDRNATATELARAIMNDAVELVIESMICEFESDPSSKGKELANLTEEQKEAVLEAMNKISATLLPRTGSDWVQYH